MNLIKMAKELQSLGALRLADISFYRNTDFDFGPASLRYHSSEENCRSAFRTKRELQLHGHNAYKQYASGEGRAADLDCPYCLSVFSRPDSRKRHLESCSSRPGFKKSSTTKKRNRPGEGAKYGHNERPAIGFLPDPTGSGPRNYYNLDENEALRLPRLSATNGVIYRGEVYCRMLGCRDTTRFEQGVNLRRHYRIKHHHQWAADKKSITGGGKLKHGKGLQGCSGNLVKLFEWD